MIEHKILTNSMSLIGIRLIGVLIGMAMQAVLARGLGVECFGFFTYGLAYLSVFSVIASLGLDALLIREIARTPHQVSVLIGSAMALKAVASVAALLLALGGLTFLPENSARTLSTGLLAFMIFANIFQTARSYFDTYLRSHRLIVVELLSRSLSLLLVVLVFQLGGGLVTCVLVYIVMEYVNTGCVMGMFIKDSKLWPTVDINTGLELLNKTWPLALQSFFYVIYFRIDMLMLEYFRGMKEVGYYSSAYAIMAGLLFIPDALSRSLFPRLTADVTNHGTSNIDFLLRLLKYFATIAVPIVIAGNMLAKPIVVFLFGAEFIPAAAPLRCLFWALGVIFFSNLMGTLLLAQNRQHLNLSFVAVNTILNIGMNLFAIPRWGMLGAAVATLLTEGFGGLAALVTGLWFSGKTNRAKINYLWFVRLAQLMVAGSLMAGVIFWCGNLPLVIKGMFGVSGYLFTLFLLGWFTTEEYTLFRQILSRLVI